MKNKKKRLTIGNPTRYLRELSIIVIGIAITLTINNMIAAKNDKKDMQLYLNMVKLELEENKVVIDRWITIAEKEAGYTQYLTRNNEKELHPDSIEYYADFCYQMSSFPDVSYAFEMFKTSGSMRFIKEKDDLLNFWKAYSQLDFLKNHIDEFYNKNKLLEISKEMQLEKEGKPITIPMYDFYTSPYDHTSNLIRVCNASKKVLEESIKKIEEI